MKEVTKPTKEEQITAKKSYQVLAATIAELRSDNPEIEIEETNEKIVIPLAALKLFAKILEAMSQGKPISIVPIASEMTTQAAAEFIGCSRPYLVKLLESGEIPFNKIGRHRRVKFEDVAKHKEKMKATQEQALRNMMKLDEEAGLYDS